MDCLNRFSSLLVLIFACDEGDPGIAFGLDVVGILMDNDGEAVGQGVDGHRHPERWSLGSRRSSDSGEEGE